MEELKNLVKETYELNMHHFNPKLKKALEDAELKLIQCKKTKTKTSTKQQKN